MSSESVGTKRRSRPRLRHPAEVPFFIFMVVLNVLIIAAILDAASVLPFLPDRLKDSGWATAIRAALIGLLLLVPALVVVRETQRASTRGTAVQLSQRQFPDMHRTAEDFARTLGLRRRRPELFLANGNGDIDELVRQGRKLRGFRVGLAQLPRSRPFTVRRLERLYRIGLFHAHVHDAKTPV